MAVYSAKHKVLILSNKPNPSRHPGSNSIVPVRAVPVQPSAHKQTKPGALQSEYTFQQRAFLAGGGAASHIIGTDHSDDEASKHSATEPAPLRARDPLGDSGLVSEELIEAIRECRCLYQRNDPQYKNVKYKEKQWEKIAAKCNSSAAECKTRWKTLRDKYTREKRLDAHSLQYKKPWPLFAALEFLDDTMEVPSPIDNPSPDNSSFDFTEILADDDDVQISQPPAKKAKKPDQPDEIMELIRTKLEFLEEKMAEPADENKSFLDLVRVKMNKLSAPKKLEFQSQCLDLLNECLLDDDAY